MYVIMYVCMSQFYSMTVMYVCMYVMYVCMYVTILFNDGNVCIYVTVLSNDSNVYMYVTVLSNGIQKKKLLLCHRRTQFLAGTPQVNQGP